jgi:hypothetical protein
MEPVRKSKYLEDQRRDPTSPDEQQPKNKIVDKNVGEYVDFVETKDEN